MARLDLTGAAETGSSNGLDETLFQLGIASSTGRDGEPDLIAAHKWFNLAAMQGNGEAARYRQEIAAELSAAQIAEAQRAAREWIRRQ
jgi:TPR repeat protein